MKSKMREILLVHFIVYACFSFIIILLLFIHALVFALSPSLSLSRGAAFCGHKLCWKNYENGRKRKNARKLHLHFVLNI